MGVEKQVILLQVGAEVDQSAFTKASSVVEASAKKIDKSLISVMETSDNAGKKLIATFGNKATKKVMEEYINNVRELKKAYQLGDTSSITKFESAITGLVSKFGNVKKAAADAKKEMMALFEADIKAHPKTIGKAATHYSSVVGGGDGVTKAAQQQLSGFINALTATGNKLRSFDAKKYENWEQTQDFDKLQSAFNGGILKLTRDGFKATGLNLTGAYDTLGVGRSEQTSFNRFSGLKDFKILRENLEKETSKFSKDIGDSFVKTFDALGKRLGTSTGKVSTWYPALQQAARFQNNLPTRGNLSAEAKAQLSGLSLESLTKNIKDGNIKIVSGDLKILTQAGLNATKMTEEFALANKFLKNSFSDQSVINKLITNYGITEKTAEKAFRAVKKETEDAALKSGVNVKQMLKDTDLYSAALDRLTKKKVKIDPYANSSPNMQAAMKALNSAIPAGSKDAKWVEQKNAIAEMEKAVNKTASAMKVMGQDGEKYRREADLLTLAQKKINGEFLISGGMLDGVAKKYKEYTKDMSEAKKAELGLAQAKPGYSDLTYKKAVAAAQKSIDKTVYAVDTALKNKGVDEDTRRLKIEKLVQALDLQKKAEKELGEVINGRAKYTPEVKAAKADPWAASAKGMRDSIEAVKLKAAEGSEAYKKWISELRKSDRQIDDTAAKLKMMGKNGEGFKESISRFTLAQERMGDAFPRISNFIARVNQQFKESIGVTDKYKGSLPGLVDAINRVSDAYGKNSKQGEFEIKRLMSADAVIQKTAAGMNRMKQDGDAWARSQDHMAVSAGIFSKEIKVQGGMLKSVADELKKFEAPGSRFTRILTEMGQKFKTLLEYSVAGSFIYGLQNAVRSAITSIIQFDQSLHNLKAITGATETEMGLFGEKILDLATRTRFSVTEISDSMTVLGQAGFSASETLAAMEPIVALSAGTMSGLTTIVDLTTTAIGAFDMKASQAAEVADVFAAAINKSKLDTEKLKVAFNYVGPVAHDAGVSIEELAAMMSLLSNAGIRASTIGTSLRQIFDKLLNPTQEFSDAVARAGYSMSDFDPKKNAMVDTLQKVRDIAPNAEKALKYFGVRGASSVAILAGTSEAEFKKMEAAMSRQGSAYDMAAEQMLGLESKVKQTANRWEVTWLRLSEIFAKPIMEVAVNSVNSFSGAIASLGTDHPFIAFFAKLTFGVSALAAGLGFLQTVLATKFVSSMVLANAELAKFIGLTTVASATGGAASVFFSMSTAVTALTGAIGVGLTMLKAFLGTLGMTVLGGAAVAYTFYTVAKAAGVGSTELEKFQSKALESNKSLESQERAALATKNRFEELSETVKDSSAPLEDRKTAVAKLIAMGVNFDTSMVENINSVKDFDQALRDSEGVLDSYAIKLNGKFEEIINARAKIADEGIRVAKKAQQEANDNLISSQKGDPKVTSWVSGFFDGFGGKVENQFDGKKFQADGEKADVELNQSREALSSALQNTLKASGELRELRTQLLKDVLDGKKTEAEATQIFTKRVSEHKMMVGVSSQGIEEVVKADNTFSKNTIDLMRKSAQTDQLDKNYAEIDKIAKSRVTTVEGYTENMGTLVKLYSDIERDNKNKFENLRAEINNNKDLSQEERTRKLAEVSKEEETANKNLYDNQLETVKTYTKNLKQEVDQQLKLKEDLVKEQTLTLEVENAKQGVSSEQKKENLTKIADLRKNFANEQKVTAENMVKQLMVVFNKTPYQELKDEILSIVTEANIKLSEAELDRLKGFGKVDKRDAAAARAEESEYVRLLKDHIKNIIDEYKTSLAELEKIETNKLTDSAIENFDKQRTLEEESFRIKEEFAIKKIALAKETAERIRIEEEAIIAAGGTSHKVAKSEVDVSEAERELNIIRANRSIDVKKQAESDANYARDVKYKLAQSEIADLHNKLTQEQMLEKLSMASKLEDLKKDLDEQKITEENYIAAREVLYREHYQRLKELSGEWTEGVTRAFENYIDSSGSWADGVENGLTNVFKNMEDTTVQFLRTHELSVENLVNSMLDDLARLGTSQVFKALMEGFLGNPQTPTANTLIGGISSAASSIGTIGASAGIGGGAVALNAGATTGSASSSLAAAEALTKATNGLNGVTAQTGSFFSGLWDNMSGFFGSFGKMVTDFFSGFGVSMISMFSTIWSSISSMFSGMGGGAGAGAGAGMWGTIASGVMAMFGYADGGKITGYSPSPTADNIPLWGTAGEFMQPVHAVKYYGEGAMEAIRTRSIPREAFMGYNKNKSKSGGKFFAEGGKIAPEGGGSDDKKEAANLQIVNILDPAMFDQYVSSTAGVKAVMNVISRNKNTFRGILGD